MPAAVCPAPLPPRRWPPPPRCARSLRAWPGRWLRSSGRRLPTARGLGQRQQLRIGLGQARDGDGLRHHVADAVADPGGWWWRAPCGRRSPARTERCARCSATFWWMALLAKRVSAWHRWHENGLDIGHAASARAASTTCCEDLLRRHRSHPAYALPILILRKRAGLAPWPVPITCSGWPLPQFGTPHSVQCSRPGDGRAGVPELRGDAAVAGVLQHAHALAVADLPADLAAELEVVALVVDGPAPVGLHVDARGPSAEDFVERLRARLEAHVGHADQRQARPAVGAHAAVGARLRPPRRPSRATSCSPRTARRG